MTELAQWTVPAPSWLDTTDDLDAGTLAHPEIIEFSGDDFVDQLRDVLDGGDPQHRRLSAMHPKGPGTEADPWRLFQPLHARYYMVTGSLVCRRAGLPDRAVDRRAGQSASFVVRRVVAGREQAWVPSGRSGAWRDLSDPATLFTTVNGLNGVVAEERHKMQPMTVTASSGTGEVAELFGLDEPGRRQIWVGYLPVVPRVEPRAENGRGAAIVSDANATVSASNQDNAAAKNDPRMMVATIRVLEPWRLLKEGDKNGEVRNDDAYIASFYWLLEMSDLMHQWFPDELAAARRDPYTDSDFPAPWPPSTAPAVPSYDPDPAGANGTIRSFLRDTYFVRPDSSLMEPGWKVAALPGEVRKVARLADVLVELAGEREILRGHSMPPKRDTADKFDVRTMFHSSAARRERKDWTVDPEKPSPVELATAIVSALAEDGAPPVEVPEELVGLIAPIPDRPATDAIAAGTVEEQYVVRLGYEHEPCMPVLSEPSRRLVFAKVFDPGAPARPIRIELPDPSTLRRNRKGVAFEMPPALRNQLARIGPGLLKGDEPGDAGDFDIAMICAFSIQIITLVAFVVMFIFLILLNIVFWWLPFLKVCFPVPTKKQ